MIKYAKIDELGDITTTLIDPTNPIHLRLAAESGMLPLVDETQAETTQAETTQVETTQVEVELGEFDTLKRRYRTEEGRVVRYTEQVVNSPAKIESKIKELCAELSDSDYKVVKCQEQMMAGESASYDTTELHNEREAIRVQIRELEALLEE
ncbi:MAG: hypothetical protein R3Y68_04190 [Rikenellaceae bacterium]